MKYIELTKGKRAIVDDEDYPYLSRFSWHIGEHRGIERAVMRIRGNREDGEGRRKAANIYMEQLLLPAKNGLVYIHLNKNSLDCRKENLHLTSKQHAMSRSKKRKNTSSKYKGVAYIKPNRKWRAILSANKTHYWLGLFATEKEAAIAYNEKAREIYGELAYQNIIE
jgi:hypothetical protein